MTKKTRILISLVLVAVAFVAGIAVYAQGNKDRNAQADGTTTTRYTVDANGKIEPPPTSTTAAKGTAENPFFILEIVPYEAMGTIGYHIAGCEPINMKKAAYASASIPGEAHLYEAVTKHTEYLWKTADPLPDYYPASPTVVTDVKQYGTMKYVGDGTGNYKIKDGCTPSYIHQDPPEGYEGPLYKYVDGVLTEAFDGTGTYIRLVQNNGTLKYEPTPGGTGGDYLWTPLDAQTCGEMTSPPAEYTQPYDERGEFKTYIEGVECYKVENIKTFVHKNNFLKYSVGLAYEYDSNGKRIDYQEGPGKPTLEERIADYKCVVYTVTPEDLNIMVGSELVNKALIERADLISFSSVDSTGNAVSTYETYKGYNNTSYDSSGLLCQLNRKIMNGTDVKTTFNDNPLDWPAALAIYQRAASTTKPLPIIWDTHTYTNFTATFKENVPLKITGKVNGTVKGSQDNLFKLYLMLYEMSTTVFESFFGDPATFPTKTYSQTFSVNGSNVTKSFKTPLLTDYEGENGQRYWANQTLYPWKSGLLPHQTSLDDGSNVAVLDSLGIMNNGGSALFHYNSGDAQNMVRNGIHIFDGGTYLTTGFMSNSGVMNDQYGREVYEFFASIGVSKTRVTTADILYYLLNGLENGPNTVNNDKYKVLELQPATKYKSGTTSGRTEDDPFWNAFIAQYANVDVEDVPVTVDRMSTSEFIGKQVECSDYDLIYIGMNMLAENWSLKFSLGTDFVYAHTGPEINLDKAAMKGWLDVPGHAPNPDPEKYFVLSGNDLTKNALDKLAKYAKSGAPILFGNGFFTDEDADDIADEIDRNSNVYELAKNQVGTPIYEYALTKESTRMATETALRDALKKSRRVELVYGAGDIPRAYDGTATSDSDKYLAGKDLTFNFTVKAPAGTKYELVLYVDTNGDGVFSANEIMDGVTSRKNGSGSNTGGIVEAGSNYVVQKVVNDRVGAVAWKLDLVNDSSYFTGKGLAVPAKKERTVHASISGLSAIKASEKDPLRILQITMPNSGSNVLLLPENGETGLSSVQQKFRDWTNNLNGLDLSFTRKKESDLKTLLQADPLYLQNNYEMLILGFGDMYDGVKEDIVLDAIANFVAAGKAVLYTHDTSSMIGNASGETWGKEMTERFRDRFGMDRYDVSLYAGAMTLPSGEERADYPYVTTKYESSIGTLTEKSSYALTQGWTNGHVYRYKEASGSNITSKTVTKVNSGAITQYPYTIPDTITVAETHPQYYQLDMEQDEMIVWYCLADTEGYSNTIRKYFQATSNDVRNNYYIYNCGNITYSGMGHSGGMSDDEIKLFINTFVAAYRASAQPVKVVIANDDATKNVSSGEYYVCVDIDSSDSDALLGGAELGAFTSYRLQEADGAFYKEKATAEIAPSKRVYFYIENDSTSSSVEYSLKFFMEDPVTGAMTREVPFAVYKKEDNTFMSTKTDATSFKAGSGDNTTYYVDVPLKTETVNGKTAITSTQMKVEVTMTYYQGTQEFNVPGDTIVNIVPRGLFDLD